MRQQRRIIGCLVATTVVLAGIALRATADATTDATAKSAGREIPLAAGAKATTRTVTLLTGDRVTIESGSNRVSIVPGAGRAHVTFTTQRVPGQVRVIPSDAATLLGAGRLDPRLFDVTTLLEYGYDDRGRAQLPLILTARDGDGSGRAKARAVRAGAAVAREIPHVRAVAVGQDRRRATTMWQALTTGGSGSRTLPADIDKIYLDGRRKPALDSST
ncbi:MAG: peptidase S8, partial [Dactylosporangium sp.]|nr:peptidase S8 [Dactylosporangium sp.]NNJ61305.1 peptidase S8 [Dactylosporangium sp.]